MTNAVVVSGLHKHFGEVRAVDGVDFVIKRGQIFSLIGPNGAGKSTTISMIAGLLTPAAGDISVFDRSIRREPLAVKATLGVVPQDLALYEDLTARENLLFWGRMYELRGAELQQRVDEVLDLIELSERQKSRVKTYSGGMKRRLNIGIALLHRPELLILDEPTVGIDPQSRRNILDGVKAFNEQGMTVLYTTHYMEEAQELSDYIAIMDHGKIMAQGTHEELVTLVGERDRVVLRLTEEVPSLLDQWRQIEGVVGVTNGEGEEVGQIALLVDDSNRVLPMLFESATAAGVRILSVEIEAPNLETVFLHLTGRALRD